MRTPPRRWSSLVRVLLVLTIALGAEPAAAQFGGLGGAAKRVQDELRKKQEAEAQAQKEAEAKKAGEAKKAEEAKQAARPPAAARRRRQQAPADAAPAFQVYSKFDFVPGREGRRLRRLHAGRGRRLSREVEYERVGRDRHGCGQARALVEAGGHRLLPAGVRHRAARRLHARVRRPHAADLRGVPPQRRSSPSCRPAGRRTGARRRTPSSCDCFPGRGTPERRRPR